MTACRILVRNGGLNVTPETARILCQRGLIAPKKDELGVFVVLVDDEAKLWKALKA